MVGHGAAANVKQRGTMFRWSIVMMINCSGTTIQVLYWVPQVGLSATDSQKRMAAGVSSLGWGFISNETPGCDEAEHEADKADVTLPSHPAISWRSASALIRPCLELIAIVALPIVDARLCQEYRET